MDYMRLYRILFCESDFYRNPYGCRSFKSTFIATTTGLVLNLILDPVLIFVFNLRVIGAALATILAQIIVTLVFLYNAKILIYLEISVSCQNQN